MRYSIEYLPIVKTLCVTVPHRQPDRGETRWPQRLPEIRAEWSLHFPPLSFPPDAFDHDVFADHWETAFASMKVGEHEFEAGATDSLVTVVDT